MIEYKMEAIGRRVIVEVLDENETTSSGIIRANMQGSRCKGRLISIGSEAKEKESKLSIGQTVLYYKQPTFILDGKNIAEFDYDKLICIND